MSRRCVLEVLDIRRGKGDITHNQDRRDEEHTSHLDIGRDAEIDRKTRTIQR